LKEALLNYLFRIIADLRRAEILLINKGDPEKASDVREVNKTLSCFRDKLVLMQLTEAGSRLNDAVSRLQVITGDLQVYLNEREEARSRLDTVLVNIPAVLTTLRSFV